jgi:hypothetical protein
MLPPVMAVEYNRIAIFGGLMATKGNGSDDGPAQGWNIFKWKWVAEPPVAPPPPSMELFLSSSS